jgi:hypothetical protein
LATRPPRPDPDDDQVAGFGGGDQAEKNGADDGGHVGLLQIKTGLILQKCIQVYLFCFLYVCLFNYCILTHFIRI